MLAIELNTQQDPKPGPELVKQGRRRVVVPEEQRRAADIAAVRHEAVAEIVRRSVVDDESERADAAALHDLCVTQLAESRPVATFSLAVANPQTITGLVRVSVTPNTTVSELNHKILDQMGRCEISYLGQVLEDDRTLADCNISGDREVHFTFSTFDALAAATLKERQRRTEVERINAELHGQLEEMGEKSRRAQALARQLTAENDRLAIQNEEYEKHQGAQAKLARMEMEMKVARGVIAQQQATEKQLHIELEDAHATHTAAEEEFQRSVEMTSIDEMIEVRQKFLDARNEFGFKFPVRMLGELDDSTRSKEKGKCLSACVAAEGELGTFCVMFPHRAPGFWGFVSLQHYCSSSGLTRIRSDRRHLRTAGLCP